MTMLDIQEKAVTHLYAKRRTQVDGAIEMYYYDVYAQWSGKGTLTLEANVQAAGRYEPALCCSVLVDAVNVELGLGANKLGVSVARTRGVFEKAGDRTYNFERVPLGEAMELPAGPLAVTVTVKDDLPEKAFNLVSVELAPVAARDAIAARQEEGLTHRADTGWFVEAGYGLMFHWTPGAAPRSGQVRPYVEAVRDLDVEAWAAAVQDTGAGYVFLTANHGDPTFPAPLEFWEQVHGGWTTERDLIADMIEALGKRGIRMMLYLNCPTFGGLKTREPGLEEYLELNCRMFEEVGTRYGGGVAGYWLDSWYQPYVNYGWFPIEEVFRATKAGSAERLVAFNHWVFPVSTLCQDYWAGEVYQTLILPAETRYFQAGAAKGLQYHALLALDCPWGHSTLDKEMEPPIWSAEVLSDYIRRCMANEGVVTVNLGIFQDGSIGRETAEAMRAVRRAVRG